jgi:hypothetical protein
VHVWWLSITEQAGEELRELAINLYSIVPHGASVERLFSMLGWYNTDTRNSLQCTTVEAMAAIKMHYQQKREGYVVSTSLLFRMQALC